MPPQVTAFHHKDALELGLEIVLTDVSGSEMARCSFRSFEGRGKAAGFETTRERKNTQDIIKFTKLFMQSTCCSHHVGQRKKSRKPYQLLSFVGKKKYFKDNMKRAKMLHGYLDLTSDKIEYKVKSSIV